MTFNLLKSALLVSPRMSQMNEMTTPVERVLPVHLSSASVQDDIQLAQICFAGVSTNEPNERNDNAS